MTFPSQGIFAPTGRYATSGWFAGKAADNRKASVSTVKPLSSTVSRNVPVSAITVVRA